MIKKIIKNNYEYGWKDNVKPVNKPRKGLSEEVVREISGIKKEPEWMREFRLKSLKFFEEKEMPKWGPSLSGIDFNDIYYYLKPTERKVRSWEDVPENIRRTYEKLGIPTAERRYLAGVEAQFDSEMIYGRVKKGVEDLGVIFVDTDTAVSKYPEILREYIGSVIKPNDNKFASLNSACWSGGTFIYVPKGVRVNFPLQTYFRINADKMGQFERTLIIADEGSFLQYVEGCLPAGEQVSLRDSWINVETIKVGDKIPDCNGELKRVKAIMTRKYRGDLYRITPMSAYNSFRLTEEHPVLAVKRGSVLVKRRARNGNLPEVSSSMLKRSSPTYIEASKLKRGDFIVFPKIKPRAFNNNFNDDLLKFLGLYTAEGSAYYHKRIKQFVVAVCISEKEKELLGEAALLMSDLSGKNPMIIRDRRKHGVEVRVYSKQLYDLCLLCCGKYAKGKCLSAEIMELPKEQTRLLVEYYFHGDGNVLKRQSSVMYRASTVSERLARQIQELLAREGHFATLKIRKGGDDQILGRKIYRSDQYIIIYSPYKKMGEVREVEDYFFVPIKKIEKEYYDGCVYNLEVEKTNSYLVRGFAVHNCSSPVYSADSLHAAVVEIIVKRGARVRYTTIQNWSNNVYNLVTKRARVEEEGVMEWIDCNIGSKVTQKYPACVLVGRRAKGSVLSMAFAGAGQIIDSGGKMTHIAPETTGTIITKSISKDGGSASYRGLVLIQKGARGAKSKVKCDALILDEKSSANTYPHIKIMENEVEATHEAVTGKLNEDQLFYLMTRGVTREDAEGLLINGFIEPMVKELPIEYAVELNRLIKLEMEGGVG